jgi:hypothetical protein
MFAVLSRSDAGAAQASQSLPVAGLGRDASVLLAFLGEIPPNPMLAVRINYWSAPKTRCTPDHQGIAQSIG